MASFEKSQFIVGINEGGYQNTPTDLGNYFKGQLIGTNWGISAPALASYMGKTPSVSDMKSLTKATAEQILKNTYWLKNHFDRIKNQSVATLIYDGVVNHGTNGMRLLMENALRRIGVEVEYHKVFTIQGIEILNRLNQKKLFESVKTVRIAKYKSLSKQEFLNGWLNRLDRIQYLGDNNFSDIWPVTLLFIAGIGMCVIGLI
jgi:lysozyme family protein